MPLHSHFSQHPCHTTLSLSLKPKSKHKTASPQHFLFYLVKCQERERHKRCIL
jgi:hypothetical protein